MPSNCDCNSCRLARGAHPFTDEHHDVCTANAPATSPKSANDDSLECQRTATEPGGGPARQFYETDRRPHDIETYIGVMEFAEAYAKQENADLHRQLQEVKDSLGRQYEFNLEQIAKLAEAERRVAQLEEALRDLLPFVERRPVNLGPCKSCDHESCHLVIKVEAVLGQSGSGDKV